MCAMGCQTSRTVSSSFSDSAHGEKTGEARSHRGAPPLKLWVRGAGEEAANGTFTPGWHARFASLNAASAACLCAISILASYVAPGAAADAGPGFCASAGAGGCGSWPASPVPFGGIAIAGPPGKCMAGAEGNGTLERLLPQSDETTVLLPH